MRKIEYRLWNPCKQGYHYDVDTVIDCLKQQISGVYDHEKEYGGVFEQYTGIDDNNGTKVFEGDIVSGREEEWLEGILYNVSTWIGECRYDDDKKRLMWFDLHESTTYEIDDYMFDLVIGNIHQHPELLEAK